MSKIHVLKTWPEPWTAMANGHKRAEFRKDDRKYALGDWLVLRKWDPEAESYCPPYSFYRVTHIVKGGRFGMPEGYVMMSVRNTQYRENVRILERLKKAGEWPWPEEQAR